MLGAIIGDIIGSSHEFNPIKTTKFDLFDERSRFTDDTVLTIAVMKAIKESKKLNKSDLSFITARMFKFFRRSFPMCGFGPTFAKWISSNSINPYYSFGNGAAMRISPVGYVCDNLEDTLEMASTITAVTHNHPEGLKAGMAVAGAVYLARIGKDKEDIRQFVRNSFYPDEVDLDKIRPDYEFMVSSQKSVPEAFQCFFDANSFEEAVRLAVSLGGDADTQACIAGAIAGEYYGIPEDIQVKSREYLTDYLLESVDEFEKEYIK